MRSRCAPPGGGPCSDRSPLRVPGRPGTRSISTGRAPRPRCCGPRCRRVSGLPAEPRSPRRSSWAARCGERSRCCLPVARSQPAPIRGWPAPSAWSRWLSPTPKPGTRSLGRPPRPRTGPLRRSLLARLAPPHHLGLRRARLPDPGTAPATSTPGGRLTSLFEVVRELQTLLACWHATCPTCRRRLPPDTPPTSKTPNGAH